MKKNLIALAVLAASGASFAQSSVTVYGLVDVAFASVDTNGLKQLSVNSGGFNTSRFGFRGTEDLGGGLKANFLLEQGINVDNGSVNGTNVSAGGTDTSTTQAFSRQSYVGFSGGFGEVKLGKMFTAYDDISGAANAAFDSNLFAPVNGVWTSVGYNDRPGNSVYYASPAFSGVSGAVSYSLGENKSAASAHPFERHIRPRRGQGVGRLWQSWRLR
jgi:predicted porin